MAARVSARLTAAEGRSFGLTVGGAFVVLAAISRWRGHATSWIVLGIIGLVLVAAALAVPTRLGLVRGAWMRLGAAMSRITTPVFLGVLYYGLLTPLAVVLRAAGRRPLVRVAGAGTHWMPHRPPAEGRGGMERQF